MSNINIITNIVLKNVKQNEEGLPKASEIKGCVAKEVGERFPKIVGLAPAVV